jgi:PAS domain S-box-containing protein
MPFSHSLLDEIQRTTKNNKRWGTSVSDRVAAGLLRVTSYLFWSEEAVRKNRLLAYSIALVAVGIAAAGRWALAEGHLLEGLPFITFYPATIVATLFGGLWPGILSVVASSVLARLLFLPMAEGWGLAVALFVILSSFNVALISILHLALERVLAHAGLQRTVMESAPSGMFIVDGEGRIILINRTMEALFGYKRSELVGQAVEVLVPERLVEKHPEIRKAFMRNPETRVLGARQNLNARRRDGSEFPVEIGLNPTVVAGKSVVLVTVVDVSDRKKAADLARMARVTMMGELAASIAHEMNQPLAAIVANASAGLHWLNSQPPNVERAKSVLKRIAKDGERGGDVIASMRALHSMLMI